MVGSALLLRLAPADGEAGGAGGGAAACAGARRSGYCCTMLAGRDCPANKRAARVAGRLGPTPGPAGWVPAGSVLAVYEGCWLPVSRRDKSRGAARCGASPRPAGGGKVGALLVQRGLLKSSAEGVRKPRKGKPGRERSNTAPRLGQGRWLPNGAAGALRTPSSKLVAREGGVGRGPNATEGKKGVGPTGRPARLRPRLPS